MVARAARLGISPFHPLVGERIFTCETGLHVHGLLKDPQTYEPYSPVRIGRARTLLFGKKTGRRAVQSSLAASGIDIPDNQVEIIASRIRNCAESQKPLAEEDMIRLAVKGMLPKNKLGTQMLKKLKIYKGSDHPHSAQEPEPIEI